MRLSFPLSTPDFTFTFLGTWRSPVAHLNGVQGVAGSNPAVPTEIRLIPASTYSLWGFLFGVHLNTLLRVLSCGPDAYRDSSNRLLGVDSK